MKNQKCRVIISSNATTNVFESSFSQLPLPDVFCKLFLDSFNECFFNKFGFAGFSSNEEFKGSINLNFVLDFNLD